VAGFAAPKIDAGISTRSLFEALVLAAVCVLSVSVIPIVRSSTAQIAPRLAGD
jgi:hypothetical protein